MLCNSVLKVWYCLYIILIWWWCNFNVIKCYLIGSVLVTSDLWGLVTSAVVSSLWRTRSGEEKNTEISSTGHNTDRIDRELTLLHLDSSLERVQYRGDQASSCKSFNLDYTPSNLHLNSPLIENLKEVEYYCIAEQDWIILLWDFSFAGNVGDCRIIDFKIMTFLHLGLSLFSLKFNKNLK